jgi:hypothetical protein
MLHYGGFRFEFRPGFDYPPFCCSLLQFLQAVSGVKIKVKVKVKVKAKAKGKGKVKMKVKVKGNVK